MRIPVHCHERAHPGKAEPAFVTMHHMIYELFPVIRERTLEGNCFDNMTALLPEYVHEEFYHDEIESDISQSQLNIGSPG